MSKLLVPASGFACLAWLSVWSWFLSKEFTHRAADNESPAVSISITDEEFTVAGGHAYFFTLSDAVPVVQEGSNLLFKTVAERLSKHPSKRLILSGLYSPVEHNKTTHVNLGIARAEAIKSFLTSAGAPPENIQCEGLEVNNIMLIEDKIYGGVYFRFTQDATTAKRTAESEEEQAEKSETLSEKPAGDVQYIRFRAGSYKLEDSDERTLPMLDRLVAVAKKRTSDKIIITGFSEKEEDAATSVKLAEARARSIRRYLVDNGVRRSQIEMKFKTGLSDASAKGRAEITVEK